MNAITNFQLIMNEFNILLHIIPISSACKLHVMLGFLQYFLVLLMSFVFLSIFKWQRLVLIISYIVTVSTIILFDSYKLPMSIQVQYRVVPLPNLWCRHTPDLAHDSKHSFCILISTVVLLVIGYPSGLIQVSAVLPAANCSLVHL